MRYQGTMRLLLLCLAALAAAACWTAPARAAAEPLALEAIQRKLDPENPALDRIGPFQVRGLLELRSEDPRFGGLSGLVVSADGRSLEAVSDRGDWIAARPVYDTAGRLVGLADGRIAALRGLRGEALGVKFRKDAESLAPGGDGDGLLVAFEHEHRIWRYPRAEGAVGERPVRIDPPPGIAAQPANEGIEALEQLADGSLLAIGSKTTRKDHYPAFLLRGGAWQALWYHRGANFEPTGAALLPDGDLLVLERHFSLLAGVSIRLVRVAGSSIAGGATLSGEELARLRQPLTIDNYEGIAARRGADGETLIYLLSDDNFNLIQRTLLMLLSLPPAGE